MNYNRSFSAAALFIVLLSSCDLHERSLVNCCSPVIDTTILIRFQETLEAKYDMAIFGTSASTLYYEEGNYALPDGDSCTGLTTYLTFGPNEFVGRVGKGSQFEGCGAKWLVTDITSDGAHDSGTITLALLPETDLPEELSNTANS